MINLGYPAIEGLYRLQDFKKKRKLIRNLSELEQYLREAEVCFAESDEKGLASLQRLRFAYDIPRKLHPDSAEYKNFQIRLYHEISGRSNYDPYTNEQSPFDLESGIKHPYPYSTRSPRIVSEQLAAQALIFTHLPLHPPARIVEFGPGWGNVTLQLAQLGFQATAVEIDSNFASLLRARARNNALAIDVKQTAMLDFEFTEGEFELALFFESFHHCLEPHRMLRNLHRMLKPKGFAIFAAEPVTFFPYPWGIRTDGLSLWSIRKYGWLELGFSRGYWYNMLRESGFSVTRYHNRFAHIAQLYVCQKT
jgi:2-polyprenyl-3-methyl-5-hydroxy-6-metoxy-1,4-benzoquinol methylase